MTLFDELEAALPQTLQADRHRLRQRLRGLRKLASEGKEFQALLGELHADLDKSIARRNERAGVRSGDYVRRMLPVVARREEIAAAIREHQVVVVCGETGCGKSTQLPKICLEIGRGVAG